MNSKVVKWFICQNRTEKPDGAEKKRSLFKERTETLRKYTISRLSIRKRHKNKVSNKSEEEDNLNISPNTYQMSMGEESNNKTIPNNITEGHIYDNIIETYSNHGTGAEKLIKQSSADSSFNKDEKDTPEKEKLKRSSFSLPEQFSFPNSEEQEIDDDNTENSECDASSSDSVETIKKVDNLAIDSFNDCTKILAENEEKFNDSCALRVSTDDLYEEDIANELTNTIDFQKREYVKDNRSDLENSNMLADSIINNNTLDNELNSASDNDELHTNVPYKSTEDDNVTNNSLENEIKKENNYTDPESIKSNNEQTHFLIDSDHKEDTTSNKNSENEVNSNQACFLQEPEVSEEKSKAEHNDKNKNISDKEDISNRSSPASLSKSNSQNENIAIFDDDGDISATSPKVDIPTSISKSQQIIENNVRQLKKIKFNSGKHIKTRTSIPIASTTNYNSVLQSNKKEVSFNDELSKVKIVITHPSPKKFITTTHSKGELSKLNNLSNLSHEQYPEDLNPFSEDIEDEESQYDRSCRKELKKLHISEDKSTNPFGSDSEEELVGKQNIDSQQNLLTLTNGEVHRKQLSDNSKNPFAIYEDLENNRLSLTNPFSDDSEDGKKSEKKLLTIRTEKEDLRPSLPPKLDYRMRKGSLSSTPIPHPRRSKQRHHGSSNSLNSTAFFPVPYPRSFIPSDSSETLNSSLDYDDGNNFVRGSVRSSLPVSAQVRISRKKRAAPRPPNQFSTQRSISNDRSPLRQSDNSRSKESLISTSYQTNQPPPRPPPPKTQLRAYKPNIKEKILRIM